MGKAPWGKGNYPATEPHPARSLPPPARSTEVRPGNWMPLRYRQADHYSWVQFKTVAPTRHSKFGLVLWHINHCRLFNAKSFLYIDIKYIWLGFVGFYGISTIVSYLMPNLFYTYILNIWLIFLNEPELIFLHC